jgi:hypothetical protein
VGIEPSPLSPDAPPPATFLVQAALARFVDWEEEFGGASGELRVIVQEPGDSLALPDSLPGEVEVAYEPVEGAGPGTPPAARPGGAPPPEPGLWNLLLRVCGTPCRWCPT